METKHGVGAATWCKAKGKVISEIRKGVKKAVAGQKKKCQVALPEHFTYEVTYKDWKKSVHDVVLSGNAEGRYLHK